MNAAYDEIITQFPLFKGITKHGAQAVLEIGEIAEHRAGDVLFRENDPAAYALLVLTGKLQVYVERNGSDLVLNEAGPGTIVGELALLCGIPRSASVRASEPSAVLKWSAASFRGMLLRDAFLGQAIFRAALRTLIEKERFLIDSMLQKPTGA